jgi:hypothetical protein
MVDQPPLMLMSVYHFFELLADWCHIILHVAITNRSISDIKMNSEKVEGLCFPLLFPHGESGYTNAIKDHLSPAEYAMTRMLMPEEIRGKYMTVLSEDYKLQTIDSCNGKPFASDEDVR